MNQGRDEEALQVLSNARQLPPDHELVQIEFLCADFLPLTHIDGLTSCNREIRAQYLFEKETSAVNFPNYQDGSFLSNFKLGFYGYASLLTSRSG